MTFYRKSEIFRRGGAWLLLLSAFAAICGGCSKKIWITRYPSFWTPDLKSVAVVPFRNSTSSSTAGQLIADRLAATLAANGTYEVLNRNDLAPLLEQRDLKLAFGSQQDAVTKIRALDRVQAIITGTVTTFSATSQSQRRQEPKYRYVKNKGRVFDGYRIYVFTRNEANVDVTASLIRVSDGQTIYSTPSPARGHAWAQGSPSPIDSHACLSRATDHVISQLTEHFAVVRKQIKVNPRDDFKTAAARQHDQWIYSDEFSPDDEKMFIVVKLPRICDRNPFRITISRLNAEAPLVSREILWKRNFSPEGYGFDFSPKELAEAGGTGQYVARFHSGQEVTMEHKFSILPPKQ